MSRSLADFDSGDLSLYFRASYVLDTKKDQVVLVDMTENECGYVRDANGNRYDTPTMNLRQWWPGTRGVNYTDGPFMHGVYMCRTALRQSRRTSSGSSLSAWGITNGTATYRGVDLRAAAAAHKRKHYCGLGLTTLARWLERYGKKFTIYSCAVGARLLYVPDSRADLFVGRLFYAPLGVIGRLDINKGKLYRISDRGIRAKRSEATINRFMEG